LILIIIAISASLGLIFGFILNQNDQVIFNQTSSTAVTSRITFQSQMTTSALEMISQSNSITATALEITSQSKSTSTTLLEITSATSLINSNISIECNFYFIN